MPKYLWRGTAGADPFLSGMGQITIEEIYFETPESGKSDELARLKASTFYREFSESVFDTCRKAKSELWKCISEMEV